MVTKRITISGISGDASADALLEAVRALEKVLRHPVAAIRLHTVSTIESDAGQEEEEDASSTERQLPEGRRMAYGEWSAARPAMATSGPNRRYRPGIAPAAMPERVITATHTGASNLRPPPRAPTAARLCRHGEAVSFLPRQTKRNVPPALTRLSGHPSNSSYYAVSSPLVSRSTPELPSGPLRQCRLA